MKRIADDFFKTIFNNLNKESVSKTDIKLLKENIDLLLHEISFRNKHIECLAEFALSSLTHSEKKGVILAILNTVKKPLEIDFDDDIPF